MRVNGAAVRPAREVHAGDRIVLDAADRDNPTEIEILVLPERQVSRQAAATHYRMLRAGARGDSGEWFQP